MSDTCEKLQIKCYPSTCDEHTNPTEGCVYDKDHTICDKNCQFHCILGDVFITNITTNQELKNISSVHFCPTPDQEKNLTNTPIIVICGIGCACVIIVAVINTICCIQRISRQRKENSSENRIETEKQQSKIMSYV